jgi:hypothetical protein
MNGNTAANALKATPAIGRTLRDAFAEVAALLFGSATFTPRHSVVEELRCAVEPHLAVLVHKRNRCLSPEDGNIRAERWASELDDFVTRNFIQSALAANRALGTMGRGELTCLVDRLVEAEQCKAAARGAALPLTSRFDSSWAD